MTEPISDKPKYPPPPFSARPPWRHRYRWVLFVFIAAFALFVIYMAWVFIRAWLGYVNLFATLG